MRSRARRRSDSAAGWSPPRPSPVYHCLGFGSRRPRWRARSTATSTQAGAKQRVVVRTAELYDRYVVEATTGAVAAAPDRLHHLPQRLPPASRDRDRPIDDADIGARAYRPSPRRTRPRRSTNRHPTTSRRPLAPRRRRPRRPRRRPSRPPHRQPDRGACRRTGRRTSRSRPCPRTAVNNVSTLTAYGTATTDAFVMTDPTPGSRRATRPARGPQGRREHAGVEPDRGSRRRTTLPDRGATRGASTPRPRAGFSVSVCRRRPSSRWSPPSPRSRHPSGALIGERPRSRRRRPRRPRSAPRSW